MSPALATAGLDTLLSRWESAGRPVDLSPLCSDDPSLAAALRYRINALSAADRLLGQAAPAADPSCLFPHIPGYRLLRPLGQGGMGIVYLAEQLATRRQVALKLLPPHLLHSPKAQARFEREVELAARLDHPNIARVFDSGLVQGSYFYAMEFVEGPALTPGAVEQLTLDQKLTVVRQIALALGHAHSRGILHRDLKPTNVLLTQDSEPKLLDFGLARDLFLDSTLTVDAPFLGTIAYAPPEQIRHEPTDVRSDLYSLGILSVELLTGRHPYDLSLAPGDLLRSITHGPLHWAAIAPTLDSDLQRLLAKATTFDAGERYQTAAQLAEDIAAFQAGYPLPHARRATLAYRTRKFVARHRLAVAATLVVLLMLIMGATFTTSRILTERSRAQRSAHIASEANSLIASLIAANTPAIAQGREVTVREILDQAIARAQDDKSLDPEVREQLLLSLGQTLNSMGQHSRARPLLQSVVDGRLSLLGPNHPDTLAATLNLGACLLSEGKDVSQGLVLMRQVWNAYRTSPGPADPITLNAGILLSSSLEFGERFDEMEQVIQQLQLDARRAAQLPERIELNLDLARVSLHTKRGEFAQAAQVTAILLQRIESQFGPNHTRTSTALFNHGIALRRANLLAEAETVLRRCLTLRITLYGTAHSDTNGIRFELARTLYADGRIEEASALVLAIGSDERMIALVKDLMPKIEISPR